MSSTEIQFGSVSPWLVDPDTLAQLRLERAQSEFEAGRLTSALVEAEELLRDSPKHWEALRLVANVALRLGDAALATEAFSQLLKTFPADPDLLAGMAIAQFGMARLVESERLARESLTHEAKNPQALYCLALNLERTERLDEADDAFQMANSISPEMYPNRPSLEAAALNKALDQARIDLDPIAQRFYSDVEILWKEFPDSADLRASIPPLSPFVEALYEGIPPTEGEPWKRLPSSVRLFRGNLAWGDTSLNALVDRIRVALTREAHHWLGIPPKLSEPEASD